MRVDYLGLEAFVAVAELGSFSKAAHRLNLSQTALSHRIRKIEGELGTRLLARTSREVTLTKSGQALVPQVKRHLEQLSELYGSLREEGRHTSRRLAFACLPTISHYYLPEILMQFSRKYSEIQIVLQDQPAGRILDIVKDGEVEFGVTIVGARHWDLEVQRLCTEPYVLLVSRDHPLAGRGTIRREDLVGQAFVRIRTQSINRTLVDEALGDVRDRIIWRYEVQNAATAMSLVAAGMAVTVLPKLTSHLAADKLVGLAFSDVEMSRSIGIVHRRGAPISKAGQRLISMIRHRLSEG